MKPITTSLRWLTVFSLFLTFSPLASGQTFPSTPPPPEADSPITTEQESLFDELMEREIRREPESARILQEDPAEAAELVGAEELDQTTAPAPVVGTFLQLTRQWIDHTVEDWREVLGIVEDAGMSTIIIQWTAVEPVAFFEPAPPLYTETYPLINRLFEALKESELTVVLGLSHDPNYWKNINARNDVRDVYFRVRNTHNLRLQEALLEAFDSRSQWTGYYLSEEIDDINWREPADESVFHQFLLRSGRIVRERDPDRSLSISSFFRKRTAPSTYADNLLKLMTSTEVDQLWIQDGIGVEPLSSPLIEPYYRTLALRFATPPPGLGTVVELFETTSAPEDPFAAQTALPRRVRNQLRDASMLGGPIIVFSLFDYADPRKGGAQKEVYNVIRDWNREIAP